MEKKLKPVHGVKNELDDFLMDTTAHGIKNTVRSDLWTPLKIVWLIIFLSAMAGNAYHLSTVVSEYLNYPKQEVTSLAHDYVRFPYVTVCNQEAASTSAILATLENNTSPLSLYETDLEGFDSNFSNYELSSGIAVDDLLDSPLGIASNLSPSEVQALSHTQENFIISCNYKGHACDSVNDFQMITTSEYWNCFTFTGQASVGSKSISASPSNGLSLVLFLESKVDMNTTYSGSYNTYSNTGNSQGVRVIIHENNTFPRPHSAGFNALPGHSTSVSLEPERVTKLGRPYGTCINDRESNGYGGYSYTTDHCLEECLARHIIDNCGCVDNDFFVPSTYPVNDYRYCLEIGTDFSNFISRLECVDDRVEEFNENENDIRDSCNCREACESMDYSTIISQSKWPAEPYMRDMYHQYISSHPNAINLTASLFSSIIEDETRTTDMVSLISNNFARLNVYFQGTSLLVRAEQPSYSFGTLWSNIGGTIGLWAGLSIITIVELIFFLVRLCYFCIKARKVRQEQK